MAHSLSYTFDLTGDFIRVRFEAIPSPLRPPFNSRRRLKAGTFRQKNADWRFPAKNVAEAL